jgi:autophagy-related protein 2
MVEDDLPTNQDYLDDSFSATAGLKEWSDDDLAESDNEISAEQGLIANLGGETIRLLNGQGLNIIEHHFDALPPEADQAQSQVSGFFTDNFSANYILE